MKGRAGMQVLCSKCGKGVDVGLASSGATVMCPHCQAALKVPRLEPGDTLAGIEREEVGFAELSRQKLSGRIEVGCNQCRRMFIVPAEFGGQRAKCPACGYIVQVPEFEAASGATPQDGKVLPDSIFREEIEFSSPQSPDTGRGLTTGPVSPAPLVVEEPLAAEDVLAAVSSPPPKSRRRNKDGAGGRLARYGAVLAVAMIGALSAIVLYEMVLRPFTRRESHPTKAAPEVPAVAEPIPIEPVAAEPVPSEPAIPTTNPAEVTSIRLHIGVFATAGYLTAGPKSEFWQFQVEIAAGDKNVVLADGLNQATLSAGGNDGRLVAVFHKNGGETAKQSPLIIPARNRKTVTFIFDMPVGSGKAGDNATLEIVDVGRYSVPTRETSDAADESIVGAYVELVPRNLQPLLRDPIMAAIQNTPRQQLIVTSRGEAEFDVSLPAVSISGTATPDGESLYRLTLTDGQDTLDCRLRAIGDGRLLLYLSDAPFHQIAFGRGQLPVEEPPDSTPSGFQLPGEDDGPTIRPPNGNGSIFDR